MSALIERLIQWIESVIASLGYVGIAFVMALENVFPPIPSELVMPFAGWLAACAGTDASDACRSSTLTLPGVIVAGMVGSVIGALMLYYVGFFANEAIIRRFIRRFGRWFLLSEADLDTALAYFSRYGDAVIFFGRLIPLIRSLISIPAGMQRMPIVRFLVFTGMGTTIWSGLLAGAGYLLRENWEQVMGVVESYQNVVVALIAAAVAVFIYWKLVHPRLVQSQTREEGG